MNALQRVLNSRVVISNSMVLKLLLLLPITTLFQSFSVFDNLNKLLIVVVLVAMVASMVVTRYSAASWGLFLSAAFLAFVAFVITGGLGSYSSNLAIYLPFTIVVMVYFANVRRLGLPLLERCQSWIKGTSCLWCFLVAASALIPSCYQRRWGGDIYFGSFAGGVFRLAPAAFLVLLMLTYLVHRDRDARNAYLACSLVVLYCGFMGGSRTYFAVIALTFVLFLKAYCKDSAQFKNLTLVFIVLGAAAVSFTAIGSKISSTQYTPDSYFDYWGTITNGRSIFWEVDMEAFAASGPVGIVFGQGYDSIYEINSTVMGAVWAHNDFINLLVCNGLFGLALYLATMADSFGPLLRHPETKPVAAVFLLAWLINAFFNMSYTYTCAAVCVALAPLVIGECFGGARSEATVSMETVRRHPNALGCCAMRNAHCMRVPRFSVVVPVYNTERYLRESVASLAAQTYPSWQVVLVDDGSTDASPAICDELASELKERACVVHQDNAGLLAARRAGLRAASGDVVVVMDSDDTLRPDALELIARAFDEHAVDMVVYGFSRRADFSQMGETPFEESGFVSKLDCARRLCSSSTLNSMWTKAVRRECIDVDADYSAYGRLNLAEDMLQTLPIIDAVGSAWYLHEALYFYRPNPSSLTHIFDPRYVEAIETCFSELRKHAARWADELGDGGLPLLAASHSLNEYAMAAQNAAEGLPKGEAVACMERIAALPGFSECLSVGGALGGVRWDRRLIVGLLRSAGYDEIVALARAKRTLRGLVGRR